MGEDLIKVIVVGFAFTLLISWLALSYLSGGAEEYGVDTSELDSGNKIDFIAINKT